MHGIQTIQGINARNAEAQRILDRFAAQDGRQPSGAVDARFAKTNPLPGGVQPWSAGDLFPGIVATFGDGTFQASYRGVASKRFATHAQAANWIISRKAEFSHGVR